MNYSSLKQEVWRTNLALKKNNLIILTWGNASAADHVAGVMAIKPSGVDYNILKSSEIVVLSLKTGEIIEGSLHPSSDTPTHLALYQAFPEIGAIIHTHSPCAASWAQAGREIPCLGTTHADNFYGNIPVTRPLTTDEINTAYEENTGKVIVEHFKKLSIDPLQIPAILVPHHGPFVWGDCSEKALENSIVLEEIAKTAIQTFVINSNASPLPKVLLDKHFLRKHGEGAYYGQ
ncbi:MAG: L-ribulose-5-phosphate 4-epimerase AraD [Spirochaetota bacterium]